MKIISTILRNYKSLPKTFQAGVRYSKANNTGVVRGLAYGARKASKKVGTLPLITAGLSCACCPMIPGTATLGFIAGSIAREAGKKLYRLF